MKQTVLLIARKIVGNYFLIIGKWFKLFFKQM